MARVKGTGISHQASATRLPRATFPGMGNNTRTRCDICKLALRRSNLARHMRNRHALPRQSPGGSSPASPTTSVTFSDSPKQGLRLKIKLPALARVHRDEGLDEGDRGKGTRDASCRPLQELRRNCSGSSPSSTPGR